jgi:hypothetical protein
VSSSTSTSDWPAVPLRTINTDNADVAGTAKPAHAARWHPNRW